MLRMNHFPKLCSAMVALLGVFLPVGLLALGPSTVVLQGSVKPVAEAPSTGKANPHRALISRKNLTAAESEEGLQFEIALKMRNLPELWPR